MLWTWKDPGSSAAGLVMCPAVLDGLSVFQLYANRPGFNRKDCEAIQGLQLIPNEARSGAWEYT